MIARAILAFLSLLLPNFGWSSEIVERKAHFITGPWNQVLFPCNSSESWLVLNRQAELDKQIQELGESGIPERSLYPMYIEFRASVQPGKCVPDRCADVFATIVEIMEFSVDPPSAIICPWPPPIEG